MCPRLVKVFGEAKKLDHAVLVHVVTQKGKGYHPMQKNIRPDSMESNHLTRTTGELVTEKQKPGYTDVFSKNICTLAKENKQIGCDYGSDGGWNRAEKVSSRYFPERFFDVGIAEEHAVTFACRSGGCGHEAGVLQCILHFCSVVL